MAKKCSHENVKTRAKCNKTAEGFARIAGNNYLICKRHANAEGYAFIPFTEEQAIEAGLKKAPAKQDKPTSMFKSEPKKRKK